MEERYSLAWPRDLFVWEGERVLALNNVGASALLLREALEDGDTVADNLNAQARLEELLSPGARLEPYRRPVYWAERKGTIAGPSQLRLSPRRGFFELLAGMQERGYFPRALPRGCVDDPVNFEEISRLIRVATGLDISWPIQDPEVLSDDEFFTLVEYFNDQAQRPRDFNWHDFYGCGEHFTGHNKVSGGAVYRWMVNELLASNAVGLRLGSAPAERGRLVRHFDSPLDDLADEQIAQRGDDSADEVAHAIRDYRQRGATLPQKKAALALLAGALEPRRQAIREKVTRADESDLFMIANRFAIRHRNADQRTDYGVEFLDWVFWSYLSTVQLMEALERRGD